jgi:hypothetical protein
MMLTTDAMAALSPRQARRKCRKDGHPTALLTALWGGERMEVCHCALRDGLARQFPAEPQEWNGWRHINDGTTTWWEHPRAQGAQFTRPIDFAPEGEDPPEHARHWPENGDRPEQWTWWDDDSVMHVRARLRPGGPEPISWRAEDQRRECPDGGTCHHDCAPSARCFRVETSGPLSGVFPGDEWPAHWFRQGVQG